MSELPAPPQLPSGTVTFLLTDIEGSTRAWERDPERMGELVAVHYGVVDDAITIHGGHRPVEQGEGDSVVAAFARASDAVAAALEAQRGLAMLGLAVRIAVHTGEARLRDEGNYFGPAIIRGARLRGIGHGGQILVSDATRLLVGDHLPDGAWWRDLGSHRLKDLGRAERVWQLCHADVSVEFPSLRSLDAFGHNLPTRLTPLIGRQADTATVTGLLNDTRLVTLVGTGGVGKTRLGLQVAAELVDWFAGGVWWVELGPLSDPGSMPGAVLAAMGIPPVPGRRPVELLADQLDRRTALFVLDNCEHLLAACAAFVDDLLTAVPSTAVLATSREPLSVPGETVWRVPSLELPDLAQTRTAGWLEQSAAAGLFLDRARRARPGLTLTDDAVEAAARICHRLDGIPLSIELAAARCRNLAVEEIARGLDDRFRLLTGGARTVVARQQTMKASIDWSHEFLDASERAALRRLGVFAGPFTIEAAEAVIGAFGDVDHYGVLDLIDHLADKSLIAMDDLDPTGEAGYRLLETIRHYALDRLTDAGELVTARDAHAAYWARWAERHNLLLDPSVAVHDAVLRNLANLSAAARWSLESRPELLQPLMLATGMVVRLDDDDTSGTGLFKSALAALDGVDDVAWAHVAVSAALATILSWVALPDEDLCQRVEAIAVAHDLTLVRATLAHIDAWVNGGDADGMESAEDLFALAGSHGWSALVGTLAVRRRAAKGQLELATDRLEAARTRWSTADLAQPSMIGAVAHLALVQGLLTDAARAARDGLEGFAPPGSSRLFMWTSVAYETVARVAFFSAERDILAWAADALERGVKNPAHRRYATLAAAHLTLLDRAVTSPSTEDRLQPTLRQRVTQSALGGGILRRETPYLAIASADPDWIATERAALVQFAADGDPRVRCFMHLADGVLALQDHDDDRAETHWHDLLALASAHGFGLLWIDALEGLAICAARAGSADEAARLAGAAVAAREARSYRYRYPHAYETPEGSEEGRALSLGDATLYARRARGERRRPTAGWASLTPTELEVVRAVAAGLSNSQAAEKLFVTVPTIKTHLSHIFAKLDVDSRSRLAAIAATHGL